MTNTQWKMPLKAACLSALMLAGLTVSAQSAGNLPQKGAKVFVTSGNAKAGKLAKEELQKKGYWTVTDNREEADLIMDVKVHDIWINDRKAYAVFTDPKTMRDVYQTSPVTTLMRFTFRPGHGVIKKLMKKRVDKYYEQQSGNAA